LGEEKGKGKRKERKKGIIMFIQSHSTIIGNSQHTSKN
jgi:hypothetical protein